MTEPTDAELLEVIREAARGGAIRRDGSTSLRIARAVLAKWGTPPADASEKAGLDGVRAKAREIAQARFGLPKDDYWGEAELCIGALEDMLDWLMQHGWSAPQPTQAQAGAVPLTDEQKHARNPYRHSRGAASVWMAGFEAAELWYRIGIKGGQHD